MKLTDLNPRWFDAGGEGVYDKDMNPAPKREGVGINFDCPCGNHTERWDRQCFITFNNPLDGGRPYDTSPLWNRTGDTFDTLTITPSILRSKDLGGCGWHGFITNGEVI
jgi:hypothetical protein